MDDGGTQWTSDRRTSIVEASMMYCILYFCGAQLKLKVVWGLQQPTPNALLCHI